MKNIDINADQNFRKELQRYLSFWPLFIIIIIISLASTYFYLKYTNYQFQSYSKIEIKDKAQDSEMALPTSMTIFNRSMINLDNEIGVLKSFSLHRKVVKKLKSNIKYYTIGNIKTSEDYSEDWFEDYDIDFLDNKIMDDTSASFDITIDNNNLIITSFLRDEQTYYMFEGLSTNSKKHNLPFNLTVNEYRSDYDLNKKLEINSIDSTVDFFLGSFNTSKSEFKGDQLDMFIDGTNPKISNEYLNTLMFEFDNDGISDRQLEYKRTIDFVDSRSTFLLGELQQIENSKQDFKQKNNLTDITTDATANISQQFNYDAELFSSESQRDLVYLLKEVLENNKFDLIPANIGIVNVEINKLIAEFNSLIRDREKYLLSAGSNNPYILSLNRQIDDFSISISNSVNNYLNSLNLKIENIKGKEKEFENFYKNIPENEKILRSIERELKVKESLFLLLLQKREEASINFAVVNPSIKIIDYARSTKTPISPNKLVSYILALSLSIIVPFLIIYIWFFLDNKVHTMEDLKSFFPEIPIIGELPEIYDKSITKKILPMNSRNPLSEGTRMLLANLNFSNLDSKYKTLLVTSTTKGEGKTLVSVNIASQLSSKHKVLLMGADLRNPQIHTFLGIGKENKGISDYMYNDKINWKDILIRNNSFDILLSGSIPHNPTDILSSNKFKKLIKEAKEAYDFIIVDSAPCLLVSDTFQISKIIDSTIYVLRANYTQKNVFDFIKESYDQKKLTNINLVFNGVGNSRNYGYKYGYQYGYKYGYRYGYNYGYGYGYGSDKK